MTFVESYARAATLPAIQANLRTFKSRFGVELECSSPMDFTTCRDQLRAILGADRVNDQTGGYGAHGHYSRWSVTSDSSIHLHRGHSCGIELVSPTFDAISDEALDELRKVFDFLKSQGFVTNTSTGLHISLSCLGLSLQTFRPGVFCALADDNGILSTFNRASNSYCYSSTSKLLSAYVSRSSGRRSRSSLSDAVTIRTLCTEANHTQNYGKYVSVNTCKLSNTNKLVEYRGIGGDWLTRLSADTLFGVVQHLSGALVTSVHLKHDSISSVVARYFARSLIGPPSVSYCAHVSSSLPTVDPNQSVRHLRGCRVTVKYTCSSSGEFAVLFRKQRTSGGIGSYTPLHQIARSVPRWLAAGAPEEKVAWATELLNYLTSPSLVSYLRVLSDGDNMHLRKLYFYIKVILRTTRVVASLQSVVSSAP